jgi:hypothetical protein
MSRRLAQHIPVGIALDRAAERNELVAGGTATVEVLGSALRGDPNHAQYRPGASQRFACRAARAALGFSPSCD